VTTGRKRRCGWYDAVVVNYAARVNGLTDLAITKLDVLGCLDEIKVCVAYECDGKTYRTVPEHQSVFYHAKPVYETLPGWKCDISGVRNFYQLPREAKDYIDFLEQLAGVRVHHHRGPRPRADNRSLLEVASAKQPGKVPGSCAWHLRSLEGGPRWLKTRSRFFCWAQAAASMRCS
jgi:adenylosuccinate synthase